MQIKAEGRVALEQKNSDRNANPPPMETGSRIKGTEFPTPGLTRV